MAELDGKVAIVTGGSSGIGLGITERLVREGAKVLIADVADAAAQAVADRLGDAVAFLRTDVSDQAQVRAMVDEAVSRFGGLHMLVNNAGIGGVRHARLLTDDFADFEQVMGINLLGVMAGTREAVRHMKDHGGGSILNISSVGGINPAAGNWTYHVSKSSVVMFTKCSAIDVGEYGVRVNCIAPSNIETSILARSMTPGVPEDEQAAFMEKVRAFIIARQPLKRQGHTDDIAEAALYFLSDRARYVTGTILPVDGGQIAGTPRGSSGGIEALKKQAGG